MAALLILPSFVRSQWNTDPATEAHIQQGIRYIYNLSFDSARTEFREVVRLKPDHPAGHFFLGTVEWWNILIDLDNKSHDEQFFSMMDTVIDLSDKLLDHDDNDVTALFFKGGALGFKGRLHGARSEWLKAANDGREAMPIVQRAYALAPQNNDILLGIGIYNYYAAIIPEQYPVVKPLMIFFPSGDKQKGIKQLRQAAEKGQYANVEATYFLLQLYQNYEKQYDLGLPLAQKLFGEFPGNVIFHKYIGRCYTATNHIAEMGSTFTEILRRVNEHQSGYNTAVEREAEYYLGQYNMTISNFAEALRHLYRCDEISRKLDKEEQSGFMVMANLKIGMIYDMQSKREFALKQYNKVITMNEYLDAHDQAKKYLKTPYGKL
jgi:tetratricopeptide (TPR) repeat protein